MFIYNTLTKTKEKLVPRNPSTGSGQGKIQMFVCGPTVYDYIHIGNARTFVFFDVVAKYLRSQGYEVDYIQNITDIDDKIIQRAKENNRDPLEWAREYYEKFKEDMTTLGIDSPKYVPATEHIEQVVKQVKTLIDKGHAYLIKEDGYYFDLKTFSEYGKLSGRKSEMADDAVSRIDENDKKRNKGDFCLWKFPEVRPQILKEVEPKKITIINGEPIWDTELGWGRPGWHIEDTAITEHYFGPQYDIHGGGQDLIFPHHEAEITQQESASGLKPFVRYWMHAAFLVNKDQKMSKSVGNFETVNKLLKKYSKETLRFYLLSGYYRQPLEFSDKILKQSEAAIHRISEFIQKLKKPNVSKVSTSQVETLAVAEAGRKFNKAMDDDFNTPQAFAVIFDLIRDLNTTLTNDSLNKDSIKKIKEFLKEVDSVLGIIPSKQEKIPDEILELAEKRERLRKEKKYDEADKIRTQIEDLGYKIEDTIYGPLVIRFKSS